MENYKKKDIEKLRKEIYKRASICFKIPLKYLDVTNHKNKEKK